MGSLGQSPPSAAMKVQISELTVLFTKLMQLNRLPVKIRYKSNSNRLLIDFNDPNLAVRSIVAPISIQNPDHLYRF